ncbi:MAG TPA: glycosyltransferase family 4 protein [Victivallales bacterium]|nr:glycosyltransferase family 4 protein [Victivallales bacterium]
MNKLLIGTSLTNIIYMLCKNLNFLFIDDIPTPYRLDVLKTFNKIYNNKIKVLFCANKEPDRSWDIDFGNLDYEILPGIIWRPKKQKNPISYKLNLSIISNIKKYTPSAVVLSGYIQPTMQLAAWHCRKNKIPYGITCESSFLQGKPEGLKWKIKKMVLKPIINGMSFGLPMGIKAEEYLRSLGAKRQPMYHFPNCPNVSNVVNIANNKKNYEAGLKNKLNIPQTNKIILFVGRLIDAKRPLDLINAFQKIEFKLKENWTLLFVGEGSLKSKIQQLTTINHQPSTNIVLSGWLQPDEVYRIMAISEIMVLPSEHEPWGAVVNEAMAAGTPVIASESVGSAHDLIDNEKTGFTFNTGNVLELKNILTKIILGNVNLKEIGQQVQKKSIEMGHEFAAANLLNSIKALIIDLH